MSGDAGVPRSAKALLLAALLAGLLLRAEYLRELISTPFWRHLMLDAEWYDRMARHFLEEPPAAAEQAYFRGPLYPALLAGIYAVFGAGPFAPRMFQMMLGLALVLVCWAIARRTHGDRVAMLTAWLAATYGMFIYFEGEILAAAVATFLVAAGTALLLEGDVRPEADGRGLLLRFAGGGLALGLASVTHAVTMVLVPVAIVWACLRARRRFFSAAAVLAGALLPIGVVTAGNARRTGELFPVAAQGGINFYIGNNPSADGKSALAPGFPEPEQTLAVADGYRDNVAVAAETLAERALGRELTVAGVDRYWYRQGLEWIRSHPRDAAVLYLRKVVFFWNGFEIPNNRDFRDQARRFTPILQGFLVQYAILLPFALFGLLRGGGDRRARGLLVAFLAAWTVSVCAFFVCTRFRLPAVPWVLPFGAAGVLAFAGDLRRAGSAAGRFGRAGALLVALFALTNGMLVSRAGLADVTSQRDAPFHRFNLAVLYERDGDLDRAIEEYRAAVASRSADPRIHLNLGNLLARTGRHADARAEYHRVIRMASSFEPAARANLGILATQEEDWNEAIRQFERTLEVDPDQRAALVGLAAAYLSAGRFDDAVAMHRRALAAEAAPEGALRRSLGVAYLELGLLEDAEQEALAALRFDPEDIVAILTLGRVYRFRGEEAAAERMWTRAREVAPRAPAVERAIEEATAPETEPGTGAEE